MTTQHTALPWRVLEEFGNRVGNDDGLIAICEEGQTSPRNVQLREANARFIVRAVNSHERLVAALRATARWTLPDGPCWCELKREGNWATKRHSNPCKLARAALADAQES